MNKWLELFLGLVLIIVPIIIAWFSQAWMIGQYSFDFWFSAWEFLKGGIFWFLVMLGVLFVLLGISDLRE